jgi:uncharacterized protein (DUF2141 family)
MRNFVFTSLLLGLSGSIGAASAQAADRVSVPVSGLRNDDGVVRCGLYAGAEAFRKAGQESRGVVARIQGGQTTCVFNGLKPRTYAAAAFHAENNETQMQYGVFGKSKEGYGFSRNPSSSMGAPAFASAGLRLCGQRPDDSDSVDLLNRACAIDSHMSLTRGALGQLNTSATAASGPFLAVDNRGETRDGWTLGGRSKSSCARL